LDEYRRTNTPFFELAMFFISVRVGIAIAAFVTCINLDLKMPEACVATVLILTVAKTAHHFWEKALRAP